MSWIKVETTTPDKPEIGQIARLCRCSRADAFLAFFRFFVWLDQNTTAGTIDFLTPTDVDEHSGLAGFGDALEKVRWITFNNDCAVITNYDRHNGKSAKKRLEDTERQRRHRDRLSH